MKFLTFLRLVLLLVAISLQAGVIIGLAMNGVGSDSRYFDSQVGFVIKVSLWACALALGSAFLGFPEVARDARVFEDD